jgi:hypothetical protein
MGVSDILASIDRQIAQLRHARALLSEEGTAPRVSTKVKASRRAKNGKRVLSAEGRKRIADAQKKRWAAQKRSGAGAQK